LIREKNAITSLKTKNWQMIFQVSELKNNHFLDLLDDKLHTIELSYTKEDP